MHKTYKTFALLVALIFVAACAETKRTREYSAKTKYIKLGGEDLPNVCTRGLYQVNVQNDFLNGDGSSAEISGSGFMTSENLPAKVSAYSVLNFAKRYGPGAAAKIKGVKIDADHAPPAIAFGPSRPSSVGPSVASTAALVSAIGSYDSGADPSKIQFERVLGKGGFFQISKAEANEVDPEALTGTTDNAPGTKVASVALYNVAAQEEAMPGSFPADILNGDTLKQFAGGLSGPKKGKMSIKVAPGTAAPSGVTSYLYFQARDSKARTNQSTKWPAWIASLLIAESGDTLEVPLEKIPDDSFDVTVARYHLNVLKPGKGELCVQTGKIVRTKGAKKDEEKGK